MLYFLSTVPSSPTHVAVYSIPYLTSHFPSGGACTPLPDSTTVHIPLCMWAWEWGRWAKSLSPKTDDMWQMVLQKPAAVQDQARGEQLSHLMGSSRVITCGRVTSHKKLVLLTLSLGFWLLLSLACAQPNRCSFTLAAFGSLICSSPFPSPSMNHYKYLLLFCPLTLAL